MLIGCCFFDFGIQLQTSSMDVCFSTPKHGGRKPIPRDSSTSRMAFKATAFNISSLGSGKSNASSQLAGPHLAIFYGKFVYKWLYNIVHGYKWKYARSVVPLLGGFIPFKSICYTQAWTINWVKSSENLRPKGGFTWKITGLDSEMPLPCLSKSKLQLATASFRELLICAG